MDAHYSHELQQAMKVAGLLPFHIKRAKCCGMAYKFSRTKGASLALYLTLEDGRKVKVSIADLEIED